MYKPDHEQELDECDSYPSQAEHGVSCKVLVISNPTGRTFAFDTLTNSGYEIEAVESIPIEPLPKLEPVQMKRHGFGRPQTKNLSRWR